MSSLCSTPPTNSQPLKLYVGSKPFACLLVKPEEHTEPWPSYSLIMLLPEELPIGLTDGLASL